MFLTFFIALASLIGLMVIHEFGHFILAKKFGTDVEEFGIGYPPRIFGKKIGDTIYSLNLIPFGAFVRIKGESGGIEDYRSFIGKPMWQRMAIVLGGVVSFWLVSIILLSVVAGAWGLPTAVSDEAEGLVDPKVKVYYLVPESPAIQAGIELGDTLLGFEKVSQVQDFVKEHAGEEVTLNIQRGGDIIEKEVMVRASYPEEEGALGVGLTRVGLDRYAWYEAPIVGVRATGELTANIISGWVMGLKSLFGVMELPAGMSMDLMGPVGIFSLLGEYFSMGLNYFLYLISLIAVALALANILPIPALDGGKIVFLAIEALRGKPINSKIENRITGTFFVLIIFLMLFVTIKFDIPRLF
jgi:regulator of sigma E protease